MTSAMETLLSIASATRLETHGSTDPVVAIIRLCESRRSWFVTAVQQARHKIEVVGYTPGCIHSAGCWFSLNPEFFEVAAVASGDRLEVELLKTPVALEMLEDECL